jgi:hypothetical protein
VLGTHDLPGGDQYEIRAQAVSVEKAAPEVWRQARELHLDKPTLNKRRFAA